MKRWQLLKTVFPAVITENIEFVDYQECSDRLYYWLDEKGYMSRADYKKGTVREYGFAEERIIQDFPIRGKPVYLHVRRRRWRDTEDWSVFTYDYDLTKEGSRLTPEAYALAMDLTDIFNQKVDKDTTRLKLARWYDKVDRMDGGQFRGVTDIPFFLFRLAKLCA